MAVPRNQSTDVSIALLPSESAEAYGAEAHFHTFMYLPNYDSLAESGPIVPQQVYVNPTKANFEPRPPVSFIGYSGGGLSLVDAMNSIGLLDPNMIDSYSLKGLRFTLRILVS